MNETNELNKPEQHELDMIFAVSAPGPEYGDPPMTDLRDDASAKWDFAGEADTLAAAIMDAVGKVGQ